MTEHSQPSGIQSAISLAVHVFGSGAGAYIGATTGDPHAATLAAMAGTTIAEVGSDLVNRLLSPRQEARVGAVFISAGAAIRVMELEGGAIRDDGFWTSDHGAGSEFAEGVLLAAVDCFEERKLPYLANLLANVATHPELDRATTNFAIRQAERLSWLETCVLGIFVRAGEFPLPEARLGKSTTWYGGTVKRAFIDVQDRHGLTTSPQTQTRIGLPSFDTRLSSTRLTAVGQLMVQTMSLETIPSEDLKPIWEASSEFAEPAEFAEEDVHTE